MLNSSLSGFQGRHTEKWEKLKMYPVSASYVKERRSKMKQHYFLRDVVKKKASNLFYASKKFTTFYIVTAILNRQVVFAQL